MHGRDIDDNLSSRPPGRRPSKRVIFWLEVSVLTAGIAASAALVISDYSLVQSRREILDQYKGNPEFSYVRRNDLPSPVAERTANVSWLRRMLGDEAVTMMLLPRETTDDAEMTRVRAVFPEARVRLLPIETKRVNNRSGFSSASLGLSG